MPSDPSDWDPLPELGAAQYPGEATAYEPRRSGSAAAAPAAATPVASVGNPAVTTAVAARTSPDGHAIVPTRESAAAKERGAPATEGLAAVMAMAPLPVRRPANEARAAALPAAQAPVRSTARDEREKQPWFRALPAVEQGHLQRAWAAERAGAEPQPKAAAQHPGAAASQPAAGEPAKQHELLEWFWVAYVVFFLAALPLMLVEGLAGFVRMAMAGCVTGMAWQFVPRTRLWCVLSAVSIYLAIDVVPRIGELAESGFEAMVSVGGACIVGYLASLALHEELHRRPRAAD